MTERSGSATARWRGDGRGEVPRVGQRYVLQKFIDGRLNDQVKRTLGSDQL